MIKRLALVLLLIPSLAISADYTYVQNNFTAGELSPKIYQSRSDLAKYYNGAETMLNMVPLPQGGVVRRPGFEYIATSAASTGDVRLIPFIFSIDQAYIIEATSGAMRFFYDGGQIVATGSNDILLLHMDGTEGGTTFTDSSGNGYDATASGNAVTTLYPKKFGTASAKFDGAGDYLTVADDNDFDFSLGAHYFSIEAWVNVQQSYSAGVQRPIYYQETDDDNYIYLYLYTTTTNTWSLNFEIKASGSNVVTLGSTAIIPSSTWTHVLVQRGLSDAWANIFMAINGAIVDSDTDTDESTNYTGDVLIGTEANGGVTYSFQGYIDELRVVTGTQTYTPPFTPASAPFSGTGSAYSISTAIGENDLQYLQWAQSYDTLYMVDGNESPRKLVRSGHDSWAESAVSLTATPWGAGNYPRALTFHQDRLYYGGSATYPFRIWASQLSSYDDMTAGTEDDDGFTINMLSQGSESIKWLRSLRGLTVGTDSSIWRITGGDFDAAVTPGNVSAKKAFLTGVHKSQPVTSSDSLIVAQTGGHSVRALDQERISYLSADALYQSTDLTVLADHLLEENIITDMVYQRNPFSIVWCLLDDGTLLSLTYLKEHEVVAWARHTTDGTIKSIACIPGSDGNDELWIAVQRTINDSTVTYIERMAPFYFGDDIADATYLDSYLKYDGGATGTVSGMDHLEGETVYAYRSYDWVSKTVTSGAVSLQPEGGIGYTYSKATIGLPYYSDLKTISPISNDTQKRITPLTTKRFTSLSAYVRGSYGGQYGINSSSLYDWITGTTTSAGESGIIAEKSITASWARHPTVFIRTNEPYPLNIDSLMIEMEIGD